MNIRPIPSVGTDNDTRFDLVYLKETTKHELHDMFEATPHCKVHGAMHKVSVFKEGNGGYWRCSVTSETRCRAGCIQDNN